MSPVATWQSILPLLLLDSHSLQDPFFQGLDGSPGCLYSITWAVFLGREEVETKGEMVGEWKHETCLFSQAQKKKKKKKRK